MLQSLLFVSASTLQVLSGRLSCWAMDYGVLYVLTNEEELLSTEDSFGSTEVGKWVMAKHACSQPLEAVH